MMMLSKSQTIKYFRIAFVMCLMDVVALTLFYGYFFLYLLNHRLKMSQLSRHLTQQNKNLEYKLFLMITVIIGVEGFVSAFVGGKALLIAKVPLEDFYTMLCTLSDVYSGCNVYILWIFCSPLRTKTKAIVSIFKETLSPPVSNAEPSLNPQPSIDNVLLTTMIQTVYLQQNLHLFENQSVAVEQHGRLMRNLIKIGRKIKMIFMKSNPYQTTTT